MACVSAVSRRAGERGGREPPTGREPRCPMDARSDRAGIGRAGGGASRNARPTPNLLTRAKQVIVAHLERSHGIEMYPHIYAYFLGCY